MATPQDAVAAKRPAAPLRRQPAGAAGKPMPWLEPGVVLGGLAPLAWILIRASQDALTANPIAQAMNELGLSALVLLVASLACTPARHFLGWTWPVRIRRDLGLLAFFYAVLHFLTYLVLDQALDFATIVEDVATRPFITVGFAAFVLLIPLAVTSTRASIRRLGFRRWNRLHQLAYVAGVLAVIHFIWRVKIDLTQPLLYAWALGALLAARLAWWLMQRSRARTAKTGEREPSVSR